MARLFNIQRVVRVDIMKKKYAREERHAVLRIVIIYALLGGLWIYLSDSLLGMMVSDPRVMTTIATYKGLLFIALTSALLFFLISRYAIHIREKNRQLDVSEKRFQSIFHGISDAVFIHDATTGAIVSVNRTACEMFGYSDQELLAIDVGAISLGEPPYSQKEALEFLHRAGQGIQQKFEWCCRRKNGELFWTEIAMCAETIGDERRVIVSVRDISDRKQTMEQFNTVIETTKDGFCVCNTNGSLCEVNRSYCSMLGYSREELLRMSITELEVAEKPEEVAEHIRRIITTGSDNFETRQRRKDGTIIDLDVSVTYLNEYGGRFYSFVRDITERKLAEKLLRQSEEKFSAIFKTSPDSININRLNDAVFLDVNEGFTNLLGYTAEEVIGKPSTAMGIWADQEDRKRLAAKLLAQGSISNLEAKLFRKDGTMITALVSSRLVEIDGKACTLSIARDITERDNIQKELLRMQKLESLGVLAGGIAHDFNNILTGIMGNISFARMFLDKAHKSGTILLEAEKACRRATDLAHQLLTFAKGGQPITNIIAVRQVVETALSLALRGSNVRQVIQIPDDLPAVEADEGQLNQVFSNIIINAAQAMPDGGTITVSAEKATLEPANSFSLPAGEYVRLTLADTGCGMPDDVLKRIFDPYFTTKPKGSGLGLASAYSIIARHGGHISVRSTPGRGSSFEILLPAITQQAPKAGVSDLPVTAGSGNVKSVLVMDDEEIIRDVASNMLVELGYRVQTCAGGDEAYALYKAARDTQDPFWAVIMDLTIPGGMGGIEAAQLILAIDPQACLIVSSGYSNDPVMSEYRAYGFSGAVAKPYSIQEISTVLAGMHQNTRAPR